MLENIKSKMNSREFQTSAGQVVIALTAIVVANVVAGKVAEVLNNGLEQLMDQIHGTIEIATAE
jgi:hypothetical protein